MDDLTVQNRSVDEQLKRNGGYLLKDFIECSAGRILDSGCYLTIVTNLNIINL